MYIRMTERVSGKWVIGRLGEMMRTQLTKYLEGNRCFVWKYSIISTFRLELLPKVLLHVYDLLIEHRDTAIHIILCCRCSPPSVGEKRLEISNIFEWEKFFRRFSSLFKNMLMCITPTTLWFWLGNPLYISLLLSFANTFSGVFYSLLLLLLYLKWIAKVTRKRKLN